MSNISRQMPHAENSPVLSRIRAHYNFMTQVQKRIADFILSDPEFVVKGSISDLASATDVKSEASIVRFYRTLGFDGYKDFKIQIAQELAGHVFYHSSEDINTTDSTAEIKRKIFSGAISCATECMRQNDVEVYEKATELILNARRVILLGYGAASAIAYYAHFRLLELGINAHFSPDPHMNAPILAHPNPDDLIICFSKSGKTTDLVRPLKQIHPGACKILSITNSEDSPLAALSDVVIATHTDTDGVTYLTDAMNTRTVQMIVVDTLFSVVSIKGGKDAQARLLKTRQAFYDYKVPESSQKKP